MKKYIFLALSLTLDEASAHTNLREDLRCIEFQNDERIQIKAEELPDAIKKTLTEDKYKDWEIQNVYKVKTTIEFYEVVLRKETATRTFKFDKDGKPIEEIK